MIRKVDQDIKKLLKKDDCGNYIWPAPPGLEIPKVSPELRGLIIREKLDSKPRKEELKEASRLTRWVVFQYFSLDHKRFMEGFKGREYVQARGYIAYLLKCLGYSFKEIGIVMNREHSSIVYLMCYFLCHYCDRLYELKDIYDRYLAWRKDADDLNQYNRVKDRVRKEKKLQEKERGL